MSIPAPRCLQFLAESGGLSAYAATRRIQLRRTGRDGRMQVYSYDYKAVMAGRAANAITLQPGDVVIVPQRRLFE